MKNNGSSHINRWLWFYLLSVVFTCAAVYIFVFNEIVNTLAVFTSQIDTATPHTEPIDALVPIKGLELRIALILSAGFLVILLLGLLWQRFCVRRIHRPIRAIHRAVVRMAQGKLNETLSIDTVDELGRIGAGINELAANLQELLLFIWKQSGQCLATLNTIQRLLDESVGDDLEPDLRDSLAQLTSAIEDLRTMAKAYVFYDVRLDGDQAVAVNPLVFKGTPVPAADPSSLKTAAGSSRRTKGEHLG